MILLKKTYFLLIVLNLNPKGCFGKGNPQGRRYGALIPWRDKQNTASAVMGPGSSELKELVSAEGAVNSTSSVILINLPCMDLNPSMKNRISVSEHSGELGGRWE